MFDCKSSLRIFSVDQDDKYSVEDSQSDQDGESTQLDQDVTTVEPEERKKWLIEEWKGIL